MWIGKQQFLSVGDISLSFSRGGGREVTWENVVVVLGDTSQSTVQIPTAAGSEIILLLGCLPFLSSFLHLVPHLP